MTSRCPETLDDDYLENPNECSQTISSRVLDGAGLFDGRMLLHM